MDFSSIRQGLAAALLAAFLALFVLVPAVDAMSCGPEAGVSETAILLIDDYSGDIGGDADTDPAAPSPNGSSIPFPHAARWLLPSPPRHWPGSSGATMSCLKT